MKPQRTFFVYSPSVSRFRGPVVGSFWTVQGIARRIEALRNRLAFRVPLVERRVTAYNWLQDEEQTTSFRLLVRLFPRCGGLFVSQWVA